MKIGLLLLFFLTAAMHTEARLLKVGKGQPFSSIQAAILASANGDTVLVESGLYKEKNITVNKTITLIGIQFPVLDGEHKYEILSLKANGITVKGFKIVHSGVSSMEEISGIRIYNRRDVIVTGNVLEDDF